MTQSTKQEFREPSDSTQKAPREQTLSYHRSLKYFVLFEDINIYTLNSPSKHDNKEILRLQGSEEVFILPCKISFKRLHNTNKPCKILVSCSDKERKCIQAHETACKLMVLHASLQGLS